MIFLGIGSNLQSSFGNRFKNINLAISLIEKNNIKLIKKSSFYESTSFPNPKYPKFINIVIEVSTSLKPIDLMKVLLKENFDVMLETSGSLPIDKVPNDVIKIIDFKCPSSNMDKKNMQEKVKELRVWYTGVTRTKNTLHLLSTYHQYHFPLGKYYKTYEANYGRA